MNVLHICCNLAGSTVFPQLFEALDAQGIEQIVFVPEKRAADLNKNEPARGEDRPRDDGKAERRAVFLPQGAEERSGD